MSNRKLQKSQVSRKRAVNTYAELWHGSWVLLKRAQADPKGSKWLWMGGLIFTAFSFEAYLNHIGPKIFACWDIFEKVTSPEGKLAIICERLGIDLPKDRRPRQTVRELIQFRNNLAHGKTVIIADEASLDVDEYFEEFFGKRPLATWEEYCTEKNAKRAREDIEKVMALIQEKAHPEEPLFFHGLFEAWTSPS